jgi:hypothetical protein
MPAVPHLLQSFLRLLKFENLINDRLNLMLRIKRQHLLKSVYRTVQYANQSYIHPDSLDIDIHPVSKRIDLARGGPNCTEQSTKSDTVERLGSSLSATSLKNDVCSSILCDSENFSVPVGRGAVVDEMICSELFCFG